MRTLPGFARFVVACLLVLLAVAAAPASGADTPALVGRVTDLAAVLSSGERSALTQMLASYEQETTHQIAILTMPSLSGETIEAFAHRVANAWGLGRKDVNNGILIVLAMQERRVRIQLGLGFERYISNARAAQIIDRMTPSLRRGEYAKGLETAARELMQDGRAFVAPPRTTP